MDNEFFVGIGGVIAGILILVYGLSMLSQNTLGGAIAVLIGFVALIVGISKINNSV